MQQFILSACVRLYVFALSARDWSFRFLRWLISDSYKISDMKDM